MSTLLSQQAAYAARTTSTQSRQLREAFANDQSDVYVLDARCMIEVWLADQRIKGRSAATSAATFKALTGVELLLEAGAGYGAAALDTKVLVTLAADMHRSGNILGHYYTTSKNGRTYLVFKGNQKLRKVLTGTRYLATNTKIVRLGVGGKALQASAKGGFLVTVVLSVTLHSVRWLFEDEYRWTQWLAHISTDVVKAVIAGAAGYLAGAMVAGISAAGTVAVLPIAAGVVVGIGVAWGLNELDKRFGITDSVVKALEKYEKNVLGHVSDGFYIIVRESAIVARKQLQKMAINQIKKHIQRLPLIWR